MEIKKKRKKGDARNNYGRDLASKADLPLMKLIVTVWGSKRAV